MAACLLLFIGFIIPLIKQNKFTYDSIDESEAKREINIDTDGDGLPDLNIDLDGDGIPDLNIDSDGDEIPNINIDSNGDGKPDYNIDVSGNGYPEKNLIDLKEWKPTQNAQSPYEYDTMEIPDLNDPQNSDTDVKGSYYPGDNVGGAMTGDSTNVMLYITSIAFAVGLIAYLIYKKQKDTF